MSGIVVQQLELHTYTTETEREALATSDSQFIELTRFRSPASLTWLHIDRDLAMGSLALADGALSDVSSTRTCNLPRTAIE